MRRLSLLFITFTSAINLSFGCAPMDMFPTVLETFEYPRLGVQAGVTGEVDLEITVGSTGEVIETRRISGNRLLSESAELAIKKWRFAHRCANSGVPREATARFRFVFILQGVVESRPRTRITYEFPGRVTVVGEMLHFQPAMQEKAVPGNR